tara:strand:+ start:1568 stop:1927 length:360 start_codon:yes stop_codon:yes gene_type:complete
MDEYDKLIREQKEYKTQRTEKYKHDSKFRLSKILRKKVQTTMIGALSSIEEHFCFLWTGKDGEELSPEQKIMFDTFQKVRSEILDKGNTQARNIDAELSQYDIKWLRYSVNIPIQTQED